MFGCKSLPYQIVGAVSKMDSREYFELRERAERAAAKNAACPEARRVHQQLAQSYAELVEQMGDLGRPTPHLSLVRHGDAA